MLFESGAVVLHVAERSTALLPSDPRRVRGRRAGCSRALNTVEPPIMSLVQLDLKFAGDDAARRSGKSVADAVKDRLASVAAWLGDRDYLEDRFTAGDLLMVTVLRILRHTDLVTRDAGAGGLPGALRGASGVQEGARRADGGLRRQRGLGAGLTGQASALSRSSGWWAQRRPPPVEIGPSKAGE